MPIVTPTAGQGYPSIEDVNAFIRVLVNDSFKGATQTDGEGRVYTNTWTPNITILNAALDRLRRDLTNYGLRTTREVTFIVNGLTPLYGPQGLGIPDPTVQVYLSFGGYWDGNSLNTSVTLPYDLLTPLKIGQRVTGSNTVFTPIQPSQDGLPSVYQNFLLGWWQWQTDQIFFNGSQNTMDIELTYKGGFPRYPTNLDPDQYATTYIPILDCLEALAYRAAYIFCSSRVPKGAADDLQEQYREEMIGIANQWVQTLQRQPASRQGFGDEGSGVGFAGQGWGGVGS